MKRAALILCLMASPAVADGASGQGRDLMERGTGLLLRGLFDRIEPHLRALTQEMEPALRQWQGLIGTLSQYHAPEILPNGDIILRRKVPLVPLLPEGETEI